MAEYIDRQAAVNALARLCKRVCQYSEKQRQYMCGACPLGDAFTVIEDDLPAADMRPVVFCKDCKQYMGRPWENNESGICARTDCGVGEDDFCSYGEKLEES